MALPVDQAPNNFLELTEISANSRKFARGGQQPGPLAQLIFFERGFRQTKSHVVAQTQDYHLVCIWGSLVKFQGGGVVVKTML